MPSIQQNDSGTKSSTEITNSWLAGFGAAISRRDSETLSSLFAEDAYWRDIVGITWDWGWVQGSSTIAEQLLRRAEDHLPTDFALYSGRTVPHIRIRSHREVIESHITFETAYGHGEGVLRLIVGDDGMARAWVLLTTLKTLKGSEPISPPSRRPGLGFAPKGSSERYAEYRQKKSSYANHDPEVLIVGGGHSGLSVAAVMEQIGVDALVVDRFERAGDSWRKRYDSLALHTVTDLSHLPYMPFPTTFPSYLPKDQVADFFEAYANQLEINLWTKTDFLTGSYDEEKKEWTARLRLADGSERVMHPKHIVIATGGMSGTPRVPKLPGLETFEGEVLHGSQFTSGKAFAGKRVLVVGVATSAHDIALDIFREGGVPTLYQRGPTIVTSIQASDLVFKHYEDPANSIEEKDILGFADGIDPLLIRSMQELVGYFNEVDADLIAGLTKAGMRLDQGEDNTGYLYKTNRYGGGYYLDVGASQEIVDGNIKIVSAYDTVGFVENGLELRDGTVQEYDTVIMATGYENLKEDVRGFFGDEVAERVGRITGLNDIGEVLNAWRVTPQPGLWFQTGGIANGRWCAPKLSMLIKASLTGVLPDDVVHSTVV